ncbi:hypothetical protein M0657_000711 [Pyricularia oryzae]|nr:hypothetical protein M9X92_002196 [Pyricularia oryzae]KAI7932272.1 hypothetical protein M0657_000711 [Pyricularia oryzae]
MPAPDQITRVPSGLKGHRSFETPTKNMMGGSHAGHESLSLSTMRKYEVCIQNSTCLGADWRCRTRRTLALLVPMPTLAIARICLAVGSYDGSIADAISSKDSSGSFAPFSTFLVTRPDRCVRRGMFSRRKLVQPRQSGTECEVTGRDLQVSVDLPNLALACRRKSGSITRGRGGGWVWMQHRKDPFGTRQDGQTNLIDQFQNHKRNLLVEG